ncbi:hypothetical protein ABVT39_008416 [Epinephelus coioides]
MWNRVAESPNSCQELHLKVSQRAVREKSTALQGKFKSDNQKDEMSSGTSKDVTELELLIEEITEKEQAAEENRGGEDSMKKRGRLGLSRGSEEEGNGEDGKNKKKGK